MFGGGSGLRDPGLLESALARPRHLNEYGGVELVAPLAAAYGYGIARNHPFVDGNKRTSVISIAVFSHLNGVRFDPEQPDEVETILRLAAGDLSESELADWVADNSQPFE